MPLSGKSSHSQGETGETRCAAECRFLPEKRRDLTAAQVPKIIARTSILWRSDRPGRNLGYTDGAEIYLC
jgi:hypothetical protein